MQITNNTFWIHTLGCKLNYSESMHLYKQLEADNWKADKENPHIIIIHSCAVTAKSERKTKDLINKYRNKHPNSKIIVAGCMAELRGDELNKNKNVDIVADNMRKYYLPQILAKNKVENKSNNNKFVSAYSLDGRTRCFFKVQDGCDYYCTYCTIPYARGKSRNASVSDTVKIMQEILKHNVQEVILTGVNVGDFGKSTNENLIDLLQAIKELKDLNRVRISSIEPNLLTTEILLLIKDNPQFMPHFHIPLQGGTNKLLKKMKRRYTIDDFSDRVETIKKILPDAYIGIDIITGFFGETENDFKNTKSLLKQLPISGLHVFTYSERKGTEAISYTEKVPVLIRKERTKELRTLSDELSLRFIKSQLSKTQNVLFEAKNKNGYWTGYSENYIKVLIQSTENLKNKIIPIKLMKIADNSSLYGIFE